MPMKVKSSCVSLNLNSDIDECKLEIYECDLNALLRQHRRISCLSL